MKWLERIHSGCVEHQRAARLAAWFVDHIPQGCSVLDVGCGDGQLTYAISRARPDLTLRGIDVLARPHPAVPVDVFDGLTIPHSDASFDYALFVDVLHHTPDPMVLLREGRRVASRGLLLKDHTADGILAIPTLRFMDRVGNRRYGVTLPYNYWPLRRWNAAFADLRLHPVAWETRLRLYPAPANWLFGRSLHFAARLEPARSPMIKDGVVAAAV